MYYIDDVVTTSDLISINNTQKNWGLADYIHFYANTGNLSYIKLEKVLNTYKEFPLTVILTAICKKYVHERVIKRGDVNFTDEELVTGIETLEYIKNIKDGIKVKISNPSTFFSLLVKTYYLEDIDRERLYLSVVSRYGTENYGTKMQCAMVIEHWYNFHSRTYRYISNEIMPRR